MDHLPGQLRFDYSSVDTIHTTGALTPVSVPVPGHPWAEQMVWMVQPASGEEHAPGRQLPR
jgi:hypothetical protein